MIRKLSLFFCCVFCSFFLSASLTQAYYYRPEVVKSISSAKLVLEDAFGGCKFRLILRPGKITPNDEVKVEVRAVRVDRAGGETGPLLPVEMRFTPAYSYLPEEKKDVTEQEPAWRAADGPSLLGFYSLKAQFENTGDYIVDLHAKDENGEILAGSFFITVSGMLAPGQTPRYEGYKLCNQCHHVQVTSWLETSKARAYMSLMPGEKREAKIKAGLDPDMDYTTEPKCLECHTTGYKKEGGFVSIDQTPDMAGVGCEECHGPGGEFTKLMKRKFSFGHNEVDDLGHIRYTDHKHSAAGHKYVYSPRKMILCRERCHNEASPTHKPLSGPLKEQVEKGGHKIYDLKNHHWFWDAVGHHMMGLPYYLHEVGVAVILVFSTFMILLSVIKKPPNEPPENKKYFHLDLFNISWLKGFFKTRLPRFVLQTILSFAFLLIIITGFFGYEVYRYNFSTIAVWTTWWSGIVFLIVFAGTAWCIICPWDALASWLESRSLWKKSKNGLSAGREWPKYLSNTIPSVILFSFFTWLELGFNITHHPNYTATLSLLMLLMAVFFILVYDRKIFCKYICFVGRICGAYALFAPIELRRKDKKVCQGCKGKLCYRGNRNGYPCPTELCMETLESDMYCTLCGECTKSCPNDNISLRLRGFGRGVLNQTRSFEWNEVFFLVILLALTIFHGITMTPDWSNLMDGLKLKFLLSERQAFVLSMVGFELIITAVFFIVGFISFLVNKKSHKDLLSTMTIYACIALIIAITYHLAHSCSHFFMEGIKIVTTLSDPFGYGWNLFGTAILKEAPIFDQDTIWNMQTVIIVLGHFFAVNTGFKLFRHKKQGRIDLGLVICVVFATFLSLFEFWILSLPMQMRTSM